MVMGYTKPLYLLPFDHRSSYVSGLFGWKEPLNVEQMNAVQREEKCHLLAVDFPRHSLYLEVLDAF
jgi:hypothetical protein